jgi:hypothetical protein
MPVESLHPFSLLLSAAPILSTPSPLSYSNPAMRTFYVLNFAFIAYLLAVTMPESQGRWYCLYDNALSSIRYIRSATSATLLRCHLGILTNPLSVENPLSSVGGVGACRGAAFGIDITCHPLDFSIIPTPTLLLDSSATRTLSAIAASPVVYGLVPYEDMFPTRPKIKTGLRKESKSREGRPIHLLDLFSTVASTTIVVQLLMVRKVTFDSLFL